MFHLLTQQQAAEMLCLSERTLERWRVTGTGPCHIKAGRAVRYRQCDLEEWVEARRRTSTSQHNGATT
jgi:predicted DNA-binding transcriptional regulator AlpA